MFQYNYCFGGTPFFSKNPYSIESFNTTIVSVELEFLSRCINVADMFQYNYCFGGTGGSVIIATQGFEFQYNYCFGGTQE